MNALKIKIMPESLESNLDNIKEQAEKKIISLGGKLDKAETEDIAFGLKALILTIAWPEKKDTDEAENILSEISGIGSVQIIDYRRAFG